jgi:hypothetical protein
MKNMSAKQLLKVLIALFFNINILSSANGQYRSTKEAEQLAEERERQTATSSAKKLVGKKLWYVPGKDSITRLSFLTTKPEDSIKLILDDDKFIVDEQTYFEVTQVFAIRHEYASLDTYVAEVKFPDGKIGYLNISDLDNFAYKGFKGSCQDCLYTKSPQLVLAQERAIAEKTAAERKLKGGVRIGMTREQAIASNWGKPSRINKTTSANGTREQWIYGGRNYLYFENGVLTTIQN